MNKALSNLLIFIALLACSFAIEAKNKFVEDLLKPPHYRHPKLAQQIQTILKAHPELNIGIQVVDTKTQHVVYSLHANRSFVPASNLKVFTAAAALMKLGADYRFVTRVITDAETIRDGVIDGDVVIKFSGDPSLTVKDLEKLIQHLKSQHVQAITGNLYIDNSVYDDVAYGIGWMWDDENYCFSAPINAVILNHNCFHLRLTRTSPGELTRMKVFHDRPFLDISNRVVTRSSRKTNCRINIHANEYNRYQLRGCLARHKEQPYDLAVRNPELFAEKWIQAILAKNNINLRGDVKVGKLERTGLELARHESAPLKTLVKTMLKESDNIIAGSLTKKLGAVYFNTRGTWKNGAEAITAILKQNARLNFKQLKIIDGAGASRYNYLTPAQMTKLLNYLYRQPELSKPFIHALPIAGVDGTLQYRFHHPASRGKVYAKTGTMTGVTSLSGYIKTKKTWTFSIMINGFVSKASRYEHLEEKIVNAIAAVR